MLKTKITPLYKRLSRDDELQGESNSISHVHRTHNGKRIPQYTCFRYSKVPVGILCPSAHRIKADVVMTLIADMLRAIAKHSQNDRDDFVRTVQEA